MLPRYRNPSPPEDDDYELGQMDIMFLKPTFSLLPLNLTLDIFHKSLFISPPASEDERKAAKDNSSTTEPQSRKGKEQLELGGTSSKSKNVDPSEDIFSKESRRSRDRKHDKYFQEKTSNQDLDRTSDYEIYGPKLPSDYDLNKDISECGIAPIMPRHLPFISDTETHESRSEARGESSEVEIIEPEKIPSKEIAHKSGTKQKLIKKEPVSDEDKKRDRKKHHRRIKHKRINLTAYEESSYSGSDLSTASQPKIGHRASKNYKGYEDKDSDASNSKKTSRSKHHHRGSQHVRESVRYDDSDSDWSYSRRASRPERRSKGLKKHKRDTGRHKDSDTDGSNSRASKPEIPSRGSKNIKKEYDSCESDRSYSRTSKAVSPRLDSKNFRKEYDGSDSERPYSRHVPKTEIKNDPDYEDSYFKPESYYCKVCQLALNSECTYESHMKGKKHKKALNAQMIPEVALTSISNRNQTKEVQRSLPDMNADYVIINDISKIQNVVDTYDKGPMPGLDCVKEIRTGKDINYYCELCDSPCMPSSIMPHLIGFKHQLKSLKNINVKFYDRNKDRLKREIEVPMNRILFNHEQNYGRGRIIVVKPISGALGEAGPSWRFPGFQMRQDMKREHSDAEEGEWVPIPATCPDFLDTSKSDYYCKICDSHMNNVNMWQAHIIGKRHLKNVKKIPGEQRTKMKIIKAPANDPSELERMLEDHMCDVIVGLDFIRETKGENGILYTCFLCGSSCTLDIIEHLLSIKHRIKYLEKVNSSGKIPNGISSICQLEVNTYTRETLVLNECAKIEKEHGRGRVEVYVSKTTW